MDDLGNDAQQFNVRVFMPEKFFLNSDIIIFQSLTLYLIQRGL